MTGLPLLTEADGLRGEFLLPDIVEDKKKKKADKWQKLTEAFFTPIIHDVYKRKLKYLAIHRLGHFSSPYGSYIKTT